MVAFYIQQIMFLLPRLETLNCTARPSSLIPCLSPLFVFPSPLGTIMTPQVLCSALPLFLSESNNEVIMLFSTIFARILTVAIFLIVLLVNAAHAYPEHGHSDSHSGKSSSSHSHSHRSSHSHSRGLHHHSD